MRFETGTARAAITACALAAASVMTLLWGTELRAQHPPAGGAPPASILVGAQASVSVTPDRADLWVGVESRARTAALASAETARIQAAVLQAIRSQGVTGADLQTRVVQVLPEFEYPREGGRPRLIGFIARNELTVTLRDLSMVGAVMDVALAAGSTQISGPHFTLSNPDSARREALDAAVRMAMADAQVMARAAGVRLGTVLEISQPLSDTPELPRQQMLMRASAEAAPTPIEAGVITITATVQLRIAVHQ